MFIYKCQHTHSTREITVMFKLRTRKNIKKLTILAPVLLALHKPSPRSPIAPTAPVVVLIAKYHFSAANEQEISIEPKEYMKLLDRPGNGWLKVQKLDKYDVIGYVPASYVSIEVNDTANPISLEWLMDLDQKATPQASPQKSSRSAKANTLPTPSSSLFDFERQYPSSVNIDKVKSKYNVHFVMHDNKIMITKTYQEFYNFHLELLQRHQLPKLPDVSLSELDMESYMEQLIRIQEIQKGSELFKFIHGVEMNYDTDKFFKTEPLPFVALLGSPIAKHDNVKYSGYMYGKMVPSVSSNTLDSYMSLIAGYECDDGELDAEKENDKEEEKTEEEFDTPKLFGEEFPSRIEEIEEQLEQMAIGAEEEDTHKDSDYDFKEIILNTRSTTRSTRFKNSFHSEQESIFSKHGLRSASSSTDASESLTPLTPMDVDYNWSVRAQTEKVARSLFDISPKSQPIPAFDDQAEGNSETAPLQLKSQASSVSSRVTSPVNSNSLLSSTHTLVSSPMNSHSLLPSSMNTHTLLPSPMTSHSLTPSPIAPHTQMPFPMISRHTLVASLEEPKQRRRYTQNNPLHFIKIKVVLNNTEEDIVALRIKRSNLISVAYLKKLLSYKIYKDINLTNHYNLEHQEGGCLEEELLEHIRNSDKVSLRLIRIRGGSVQDI